MKAIAENKNVYGGYVLEILNDGKKVKLCLTKEISKETLQAAKTEQQLKEALGLNLDDTLYIREKFLNV